MRPHLHFHPASLMARPHLPRRSVRLRLTVLYGALFLASGAGLLAIAITNVLAHGWPPQGGSAIGVPRGTPPARIHQLQVQAATQAAHQHAAAVDQLLTGSAVALGVMAMLSIALGWIVAGRVLRPLRRMTAAAQWISEDNLGERLAVPGPGDELKDLGDTIDGLLDRLEGAFIAQRNFVANASHELRTPLTVTRTLLQMALTDPRPTLATFRTTCEEVLAAGDHQELLIEALLTLARSQRGLNRRELLDLAAITTETLHAREPDAAGRGLAISSSITAAPVLGDARLLERLAANLIDNAIRHNVPHGRLDLQVTTSGSHPTLKITNTGPLIPAGQASRLLQPFQRLSASRPVGDEGLGLGLSIVAAIAKAHNATLTINPGPHGGLDIAISFPPAATTITPRDQRALAVT